MNSDTEATQNASVCRVERDAMVAAWRQEWTQRERERERVWRKSERRTEYEPTQNRTMP